MLKKTLKTLIKFSISTALISFCHQAIASDFFLPFINASQLGTFYAGWAAEAPDASTAYTNPAGLTRIPNEQLVFSAVQLFGTTHFTGTVTPPYPGQTGTVPSKLSATLPSFYYSKPIAKNLVFGLFETTPFGLGTNYNKESFLRYGATRSQIFAIDFGPSLGFKLTPQLSAGLGLDVERLSLTLHNFIGSPPVVPDFESHNDLAGWSYGWHGGLLYEVNPCTRVGLNYASQVVFHTTGYSKLYSPLLPNGELKTGDHDQKASVTLPDLAQLSLYHQVNRRWALMGTVFYTGWNVFKKATLENVMLPTGQTTAVTVPFNYHNTFDYALGTSFKATEKLTLRTGVEWINAPGNDTDRIVADPVGDVAVLSVGAHYQQNCHLGYDIGYAHAFSKHAAVNHVAPFDSEFGYSAPQNNAIGIQITWNKANNKWFT